MSLSQDVNDPPAEKTLPPKIETPPHLHWTRLSRTGIVALFTLISLSLLLFTGQIVLSLVQVSTPVSTLQAGQAGASSSIPGSSTITPSLASTPATPTPVVPFFTPDNMAPPTLQLSTDNYVVYQSTTHLYLLSAGDNSIQPMYTPSYTYSQEVPPILTPEGQLLYSGSDGIWLTDVFEQEPVQLVQLDPNLAITSMVLSQDGKSIAWTTEPINGNGQTSIYAGLISNPQLISQNSTQDCPCFRVFSFLNGSSKMADNTLLLTDDRGSNTLVQYGLWSMDISIASPQPVQIIDENLPQGPLALIPGNDTLLYSTNEGSVAVPADNSIPADVAALSYPNSLNIASLSLTVNRHNSQVILPEQHNLNNSAQYHWVTTPTFSTDGQTLAYVEFSSDTQSPYDRHSALYTAQVSGSGSSLRVSKPKLIATSTTRLLELGTWLNDRIVTMYGDGAIYALDVQSGELTVLATPGRSYLRIVATTDLSHL